MISSSGGAVPRWRSEESVAVVQNPYKTKLHGNSTSPHAHAFGSAIQRRLQLLLAMSIAIWAGLNRHGRGLRCLGRATRGSTCFLLLVAYDQDVKGFASNASIIFARDFLFTGQEFG